MPGKIIPNRFHLSRLGSGQRADLGALVRSRPLTANRFHLSRVGSSIPARPRPTKDGRPYLVLQAQKSRAGCAALTVKLSRVWRRGN